MIVNPIRMRRMSVASSIYVITEEGHRALCIVTAFDTATGATGCPGDKPLVAVVVQCRYQGSDFAKPRDMRRMSMQTIIFGIHLITGLPYTGFHRDGISATPGN
ncbi:hypothetical protein [Cupriavidus sp. CP313]